MTALTHFHLVGHLVVHLVGHLVVHSSWPLFGALIWDLLGPLSGPNRDRAAVQVRIRTESEHVIWHRWSGIAADGV